MVSDDALLDGLATGDPDAAAAFIERFQRRVFGVALRIVNDTRLAEDVAQETFLRAWQRAEGFDPRRGTVSAWLLTIARNLAIDTMRLRRIAIVDPAEILARRDPDGERGPDDLAVLGSDTERLQVALAELPAEQRRALVLAAFFGRTRARDRGERVHPARDREDPHSQRDAPPACRAHRRYGGFGVNGSGATSGCAAVSDRLPELALGILSGTERADVLDHLDSCPSCRAESGEWAATVDVLPSLLAEAEPPAGFEARTLERLRADQARVPRRSLTQRIFALAAVVAFVMVASIAAVRIIDARDSSSSSTDVASASMIGHGGRRAGDAFVTSGGERYVFLSVDYGVGTGRYRIEAVDAEDRVTPLGHVVVAGGHGAWAGELPRGGKGGTPAMVRLVDPNGDVLCAARFAT